VLHQVVRIGTDGGTEPNAYIGEVTADVRVAFPPGTDPAVIDNALRSALYLLRLQYELETE